MASLIATVKKEVPAVYTSVEKFDIFRPNILSTIPQKALLALEAAHSKLRNTALTYSLSDRGSQL